MGVSENSTLNSRILFTRTPKQVIPHFRKLPYKVPTQALLKSSENPTRSGAGGLVRLALLLYYYYYYYYYY